MKFVEKLSTNKKQSEIKNHSQRKWITIKGTTRRSNNKRKRDGIANQRTGRSDLSSCSSGGDSFDQYMGFNDRQQRTDGDK